MGISNDKSKLTIERDYNIVSQVAHHANKIPDRVAFYWENEAGETDRLTYAELDELSSRFGSYLSGVGVEQGQPIIHMLPRVLEVPVVQLGTFKAGAIAVPCTEMLKPKNVLFRGERSEAVALVAHSTNAEVVEQVKDKLAVNQFIVVGEDRKGWTSYGTALSEGDPDFDPVALSSSDPMTINFTSGTTGNPKPVIHKHRWLSAHQQITGKTWWGITTPLGDEIMWATTAPGWAKWYWSPIGVGLTNGLTQLLYQGKFDPERYLELLEKYEITHLCATPTEYRLFSQMEHLDRYNLHLETALSAGEPLNAKPIDIFRDKFDVTIRDGYGQTETVCLVCNRPDMNVKPGSMGKPVPGIQIDLIDEQGGSLPEGEVGEIAVEATSEAIFDGYWNEPELDREVFGQKWYRTGDLARGDEEGYFWFEGRADDIIISSGYRIGPFEVEDSLVSHKAVKEAAVIGKPDEERGQIVKAYVVLSTDVRPSPQLKEELQRYVKSDTAPYKYPREIEFIEELPKTSSGKIRRNELRKGDGGTAD